MLGQAADRRSCPALATPSRDGTIVMKPGPLRPVPARSPASPRPPSRNRRQESEAGMTDPPLTLTPAAGQARSHGQYAARLCARSEIRRPGQIRRRSVTPAQPMRNGCPQSKLPLRARIGLEPEWLICAPCRTLAPDASQASIKRSVTVWVFGPWGALTLCGGSTVGGLAAGQGSRREDQQRAGHPRPASSPVDSGGHGRAHAAAMLAERQGAGIRGDPGWCCADDRSRTLWPRRRSWRASV